MKTVITILFALSLSFSSLGNDTENLMSLNIKAFYCLKAVGAKDVDFRIKIVPQSILLRKKAKAFTYKEDDTYVICITLKATWEIIAHECLHIKQMEEGELIIKNGRMFYKGKKVTNHQESKLETDTVSKENLIADLARDIMKSENEE